MSAKVLIVSPYRSEYGPGEVLDHVVQSIAEAGHEPVLVVPDTARLPSYVRANDIRVHPLRQLSTFPRTLNVLRLNTFLREHTEASREIDAIARQEGASLVYSASEAIFCGSLAARRVGVPSIVHAIGMSIGSPPAVGGVYIRLLDRLTDQFIACSAAVHEMFEAHGVDDRKIVVVHNGISVSKVDEASATALPGNGARIGMVAAFDPRKGHELFLEAAELVVHQRPDTTFFLIGGVLAGQRDSAVFAEKVSTQIQARGLAANVIRTGFLPYPEIYRTMKALDVVVVPSRTEAFAHALLEAMACAKPVVATRIEGNLDALVEGESGLYVARDPRELADALLGLIDDPERAAAIGAAAYRRVRELFDLKSTLPPISQTVDLVISRNGGR